MIGIQPSRRSALSCLRFEKSHQLAQYRVMEARPIRKPRGRRLVQFILYATHKRWLQCAQDNLEAVTLTYSRNDTQRGKGNRARVLRVGNVAAAPIGVLADYGVAPEPKNVPLGTCRRSGREQDEGAASGTIWAALLTQHKRETVLLRRKWPPAQICSSICSQFLRSTIGPQLPISGKIYVYRADGGARGTTVADSELSAALKAASLRARTAF
jgi:hypothetical protein